jgi:2,4-dienoyl-CoA reductase-like NADH-dependent reductase (Old Yellow Enzyme family)
MCSTNHASPPHLPNATETNLLLQPIALAGLALQNRIVVAPMTRISATDAGVPTPRMTSYYTDFVHGGFGLVITEGIYPDRAHGQGYLRQPGLVTRAQIDAWRGVTDNVHRAGGLIVAQLMHAGALSQCLDDTLAPSAVQPRGEKMAAYRGIGPFPLPRAMSRGEIAQAIEQFAQAARNAEEAGFDGIEIHGANGYLIDQFLTDYTNVRDDEYGGDVTGRVRFAAEVLAHAREAVADRLPVGIRLSQTKVNDITYRWPGGRADAERIFAAVRDAGAAYVHLASEGRDWHETARLAPDGLTITEVARHVAAVPVIANGGMDEPALAESLLRDRHADLVSLGRGALANPNWPRRLATDLPFEQFEHGMLEPLASLEQMDRWRASQGQDPGRTQKALHPSHF